MALAYNPQFDTWSSDSEAPALPWSVTQRSAAATAQTLTRALEAGKRHFIQGFSVILAGASTTIAITARLYLNGVLVYDDEFSNSAPRGERVGIMFPRALAAPVGTAVRVEVSAGATSVVTVANLSGWTV